MKLAVLFMIAVLLVPYTMLKKNVAIDQSMETPNRYTQSQDALRKTTIDQVKIGGKIEKSDLVESVTIDVYAWEINLTIKYKDDVSIKQAKNNAKASLQYFDTNVIEEYNIYYTLEVDGKTIEGFVDGEYIFWD